VLINHGSAVGSSILEGTDLLCQSYQGASYINSDPGPISSMGGIVAKERLHDGPRPTKSVDVATSGLIIQQRTFLETQVPPT